MATDTIFREAGDIFARLFDHRAFVQGEQNSFVTEFEAKRKGRELINLQQTSSKLDSTIEKLSALNVDEVDNNLAKVTANMSTALEMSRLILDRDKDPEKDKWLKEQRANRMHKWTQFVDDMCIKVAVVDKEFTAEVDNLAKHYARLEEKLRLHAAAQASIPLPTPATAEFPTQVSYQLSAAAHAPEQASAQTSILTHEQNSARAPEQYQGQSLAPEETSTLSQAPEQTPTLSQAPEQTPTLSQGPEQTPTLSQGPEQTPTLSQAPEQTLTLSQAPEQTPTLSQGPEQTPTLSQASEIPQADDVDN